jgi:hypothetical protein
MKNAPFFVFGGLGVLGLALGAIAGLDGLLRSKPYQELFGSQRSRVEVIQACNAHVRQAELEARAAIDRRADEFRIFVEERKVGAAPFSRAIVSWRSKGRIIWSKIPGTDKQTHRRYVEKTFAEHIFSSDQLADQMELIEAEVAKDLEAIENHLAVKIKKEVLGDFGKSIDTASASTEFSVAIEKVKRAAEWDAAKTGGSLAVSEVVAIVGTQILVRLGVSAGVIAVGAANSWWTLGTGIVLGLIADLLWSWFDDPAGDIERETLAALDRLAVTGTEVLRTEFGVVVANRVELWKAAVEESVP